MGGMREKAQADFDLERFIEMFDEALTSNDERVVNALRSLMMMVILTKSEVRNEEHGRNHGPLRQLFDDMHNLNRRMYQLEETARHNQIRPQEESVWMAKEAMRAKYTLSAADAIAKQIDASITQNLAQKINGGKISK